MTYKLVFEYNNSGQEAMVNDFIKKGSQTVWYVVKYSEDGAFIYECPTKKDAEELLTDFHIEGSHTDNDSYEVYNASKEHDWDVRAIIV